jgi:hypothetical protein
VSPWGVPLLLYVCLPFVSFPDSRIPGDCLFPPPPAQKGAPVLEPMEGDMVPKIPGRGGEQAGWGESEPPCVFMAAPTGKDYLAMESLCS